jgi:aquaporin Z
MRKYAAELIGTFFLVFTIGSTGIASAPGVIPPLAIGAVLMVMIYAGGHISGAHYNPAVTVGAWVRGALPVRDVAPYFVAQIAGSALGACTVLWLKATASVTAMSPNIWRAMTVEFLFTFALVYVILNVATAKRTAGNSYFGLAIGFTVLAGAFAVGDISGGAFNPAVAIGVMTMGLLPWSVLGPYLVAEIAAGVLAALAFRALNSDEGVAAH